MSQKSMNNIVERGEQYAGGLVAEAQDRFRVVDSPFETMSRMSREAPGAVNMPMPNRTSSMQSVGTSNAEGQFNSPLVSNLNPPMQNGMSMSGVPHMDNQHTELGVWDNTSYCDPSTYASSNTPGLAPNMNIANSHNSSLHQSNMAAPAMMPQHSQQGTNSSAASAKTSRNGRSGNGLKPSPWRRKKTLPRPR
jgi:hypothetical protein